MAGRPITDRQTVIDIFFSKSKRRVLLDRYKIHRNTYWMIRNCYPQYKDILGHFDLWKKRLNRRKQRQFSKPTAKKSKYASVIPCKNEKCGKPFNSPDRRSFRYCPKCRKENMDADHEFIFDPEPHDFSGE